MDEATRELAAMVFTVAAKYLPGFTGMLFDTRSTLREKGFPTSVLDDDEVLFDLRFRFGDVPKHAAHILKFAEISRDVEHLGTLARRLIDESVEGVCGSVNPELPPEVQAGLREAIR